MKKLLALILSTLLLLTACGNKNASDKPSGKANKPGAVLVNEDVKELRESITTEGNLCGVAYLGYLDGSFEEVEDYLKEQEFYEDFSFLKDIEKDNFTGNDGGEIYCIVPADEDVLITVSKLVLDEEYNEKPGETLMSSEGGKPILVKGNISDIMPNLYIEAKKAGKTENFSPSRSLENGKLQNVEENFYDFTPYDKMEEFNRNDMDFYGEKRAVADDDIALILNLAEDGYAFYACGYVESEIVAWFEGTWEFDEENGNIILDLTDESEGVTEEFKGEFSWELVGEELRLTHESGDTFIVGTEGDTFIFTDREW